MPAHPRSSTHCSRPDGVAQKRGKLEHDGSAAGYQAALGALLTSLGDTQIHAVGHRVVHGGSEYAKPVLLNADHVAALRRLCPLAPLHQPHNLVGIDAVSRLLPDAAPGRLLRHGLP